MSAQAATLRGLRLGPCPEPPRRHRRYDTAKQYGRPTSMVASARSPSTGGAPYTADPSSSDPASPAPPPSTRCWAMKFAISSATIVLAACATATPGQPAEPARAATCFVPGELTEVQNHSQVKWLVDREVETFLESWTPQRPGERLVATTQLRLLVNEHGTVRRAAVEASSGHASLDKAAVRVGRAIRYGPAEAEAPPTRWLSLDVTFCGLAKNQGGVFLETE